MEVEHPSYDDESRLLADKAKQTLKIAGIGGSDAHDLSAVGLCRTLFSRPVWDIGTLCQEIKAGRVAAKRLNS